MLWQQPVCDMSHSPKGRPCHRVCARSRGPWPASSRGSVLRVLATKRARLDSVGRLGRAVVLGVALVALAHAVNARATVGALRDELVVAGGGRGEFEEADDAHVGEASTGAELARGGR